jgi:hypothetical protein
MAESLYKMRASNDSERVLSQIMQEAISSPSMAFESSGLIIDGYFHSKEYLQVSSDNYILQMSLRVNLLALMLSKSDNGDVNSPETLQRLHVIELQLQDITKKYPRYSPAWKLLLYLQHKHSVLETVVKDYITSSK